MTKNSLDESALNDIKKRSLKVELRLRTSEDQSGESALHFENFKNKNTYSKHGDDLKFYKSSKK